MRYKKLTELTKVTPQNVSSRAKKNFFSFVIIKVIKSDYILYFCMEMITARVTVEEFIAQWATAKWWDSQQGAVRFPADTDIYETVYNLLLRRPSNARDDIRDGNLTICLPDKRDGALPWGKNPETFNYISQRGCQILNTCLKRMFWAECHELMDEGKHILGVDYQDTAYMIVCRYNITAITDDAIKKNYQRWRDKLRRRRKRPYQFTSHHKKR